MSHYGARKSSELFVRYLMYTMSAGASVGISHGIAATANKKECRPIGVFYDGMAGAIAGPWAPVFLPLVLTGYWPSKCPYINQKQY